MNDPIVEEVRKYRDEHARKFDYNLDRICENFRQRHAENLKCLSEVKSANNRSPHTNVPV